MQRREESRRTAKTERREEKHAHAPFHYSLQKREGAATSISLRERRKEHASAFLYKGRVHLAYLSHDYSLLQKECNRNRLATALFHVSAQLMTTNHKGGAETPSPFSQSWFGKRMDWQTRRARWEGYMPIRKKNLTRAMQRSLPVAHSETFLGQGKHGEKARNSCENDTKSGFCLLCFKHITSYTIFLAFLLQCGNNILVSRSRLGFLQIACHMRRGPCSVPASHALTMPAC